MTCQVPPEDEEAPRLRAFRHALRCPECHGRLDDRPEGLYCPACGTVYPVSRGRPVMMSEDCRRQFDIGLDTADGKRMVEEYQAPKPAGAGSVLRRILQFLRPPPIMMRYHEDLRSGGPSAVLFERDTDLVLNVGGGPFRVSPFEVTLNIGFFPGVDLLGDAHRIPFADDSVDAAFSLAVLEHVTDPHRVVAEMVRVLKPGGLLYSEIPFIFFFHAYPGDYQRFTREGIRHLFRDLEDLEIGMTHGPVSAVLQSANIVVEMLVPEKPAVLRKLANGLFRWLAFPLKYLDLLLRDHRDAHKLAGGFWVLGRKGGGQ